jgi:hypothetical protein
VSIRSTKTATLFLCYRNPAASVPQLSLTLFEEPLDLPSTAKLIKQILKLFLLGNATFAAPKIILFFGRH